MKTRHTALTGLAGIALVAATPTAFAAETTQPAGSVQNSAQGMYSANQLMDADVYGQGDSEHAIGEIDDVLLDNNMTIKSFVVETKGKMGLVGGKSYVVSPDQLNVQTIETKEPRKPEYRAQLQMTRDQLTQEPAYSDSWWSHAQNQAGDAWQQTKQSASSTWTKVKNTTSDIVNGTQDKAGNAADATGDAAGDAADATGDAANSAADKTTSAVDNTPDDQTDPQ